MLHVVLDAGASKAGLAVIRSTREPRGVRFTCLRHGHLDLLLDGAAAEERASATLLSLLDWVLTVRAPGEPIRLLVEGVEGYVYQGRSSTHLFDTADQAGGIRMLARTWARWHGADAFTVGRTTATAVRRFLFGNARGIGDNEIVLTVRACVLGMPFIPVPVPSASSKAYAAMHSYDAAAAALVDAAQAMGLPRLVLPDEALAELARYRVLDGQRTSEKKVRKAMKDAGVKVPRGQSRHTRRRRSEAVRAAVGRRA